MDKLFTFEGLQYLLVLSALTLIGRWVLEARDNSRRVLTAVFGDEDLPGALKRIEGVEISSKAVERDLLAITNTLYGRRGDNGLVSDVDHLLGKHL